MRFKLVLTVMIVVTVLAILPSLAKPANVNVGPYAVSFDLGNAKNYTIETQPPTNSETVYGAAYTRYGFKMKATPSITATVGILDYHGHRIDARQETVKPEVQDILISVPHINGTTPLVTTRTIDSNPGVLGSVYLSFDSILYTAEYPADYSISSSDCSIAVHVTSTFPWDEGTLNLLQTIHVEKVT